jgi:argininosuccinate lyase
MTNGRERGSDDRQMAELQLSELQNIRVLLEEARGLSRSLAYHRRVRHESTIGEALEEVDRQIEELRAARG